MEMQGKLGKANVPLMTKHPIILDKSHHLTTLIIRECHSKVMHNGVKETLTANCDRSTGLFGDDSLFERN